MKSLQRSYQVQLVTFECVPMLLVLQMKANLLNVVTGQADTIEIHIACTAFCELSGFIFPFL